MGKPNWTPIRVKLGELKPWAENPRTSTKAQAKRILASFEQFGQVVPVVVGPDLSVYDGHQRLSALLTVHGGDYEIEARQSDRPLTDEERRALVLALANATGSWNWDSLSAWDTAVLNEWGFDQETLHGWNMDALNLREMLNGEAEPIDPNEEWEGMPEHISEEIRGNAITCIIRFLTEDDRKEFEEFLGWKLSHKGKTYSTWYPKSTLDQLGKGLEFTDEP